VAIQEDMWYFLGWHDLWHMWIRGLDSKECLGNGISGPENEKWGPGL